MESLSTFIGFFQTGGVFMYPILFILAIGTAIVLERLIVIARSRVNGEKVWNHFQSYLQTNRLDEAIRSYGRYTAPLYQLLGAGVRGLKNGSTREEVQGSMDEAMAKMIPGVEARLHYLPSLASVATLLGLLGTIIGLIQAFTAVSIADPSQKAALLAKGISVAMNTTAFGLMVAIPLMLIYAFLQTRINRIIDTLDEFSLRFLNQTSPLLKEKNRNEASVSLPIGKNDIRRASTQVAMERGVAHAK